MPLLPSLKSHMLSFLQCPVGYPAWRFATWEVIIQGMVISTTGGWRLAAIGSWKISNPKIQLLVSQSLGQRDPELSHLL